MFYGKRWSRFVQCSWEVARTTGVAGIVSVLFDRAVECIRSVGAHVTAQGHRI